MKKVVLLLMLLVAFTINATETDPVKKETKEKVSNVDVTPIMTLLEVKYFKGVSKKRGDNIVCTVPNSDGTTTVVYSNGTNVYTYSYADGYISLLQQITVVKAMSICNKK